MNRPMLKYTDRDGVAFLRADLVQGFNSVDRVAAHDGYNAMVVTDIDEDNGYFAIETTETLHDRYCALVAQDTSRADS